MIVNSPKLVLERVGTEGANNPVVGWETLVKIATYEWLLVGSLAA